MSAAGNGGTNKRRKSPVAKEASAPADLAQTHKAARKRSQNRISQKCLREKQLAQSQHLAAFLEMIQASRRGADDNHTALMKAHLKLLEENQQIKAALLRMRKKLLSISNSAATTADDNIFDQILSRAMDGQTAPGTAAQKNQISPVPNSKASLQPSGQGEREDDGANVEASAELDLSPTSALASSYDPDQWLSLTGGEGSSIEAQTRNDQDSPSCPNFEGHRTDFRVDLRDELEWTPMMESAEFSNLADMLNSAGEPTFDLDLGLAFTEATVSHNTRQTRTEEAVRLSGKELADLVERGCIIYVLQVLDIPVNGDNEVPPLALTTPYQQYTDRLTDQMVADLAAIATNLLGIFAGLDAYIYGVGASDVMEHVIRWRIKPTTANRLAIPEPLRPTPLQYAESATHPLVIDFIKWPQLRDQLILLSRRTNIDHIIDDIVFHTVVEVRQMRVSLGVVDLFYARVFPNMDCSVFSPVQNMDLVHTTLIAGPYDEAIRSITNELSLRMAQVTGNLGRETPRDSSSYASFQDSPSSKRHPLSVNYGIDKLPQWKISQEFARKYPTLDCSDPSGMGYAVAESLSRSGWKVSIVDLNEVDGETAAQKIGGIFTKANVTVYEELANAFGKTWKEYGRIDFVFANAGIVERANFYARQEETMDGLPQPPNMLASRVMFDGAVWTVYLGLHFLRKNGTPGGSIIILASSAGIYPAPNGPLYSASKHGMVGLTRSLASRLWNENIHISCVCPGAVATGLMPPEAFKQMDQETFTPLSKIASVVESLLEREELTVGAAVEVVGQKHFLRWRPEFCDQTMEKCWNSFGGTSNFSDGGLTRNWKQ